MGLQVLSVSFQMNQPSKLFGINYAKQSPVSFRDPFHISHLSNQSPWPRPAVHPQPELHPPGPVARATL
ncbi:hypothetical protein G7K_2811-t1 [Saitoella complicata NRRL Y-17804]|uniref:Uncharacterized protein n=1 Tax=Saitoella complicata (strain BCRC 22490 / CBS 7301 / JCM 7358 / NBRC 10748 / NRRL Y-17804) TaxID=698492 RepID=A0A0E9NG27_SAICN|nr:hypothetical protein G7K_2811-t1 [Saitoella complicata NRRL Y-17804]